MRLLLSWPWALRFLLAFCLATDGRGGAVQKVLDFGPLDGDFGTCIVQGMDGDFYGTTEFGGNGTRGTIFRLKANGKRIILASFGGTTTDNGTVLGGRPTSRLVQGPDGTLYGTTSDGGAGDNGTIFSITPGGVFTTLHQYLDNGDEDPQELIFASDGNLYGATQAGGTHFVGTVFKMTPAGVYTTLAEFDDHTPAGAADGYFPRGPLARDSDGNLYGTCGSGGTNFNGTFFKVTPGNSKTTLFQFTGTSGAAKGAKPTGVRLFSDGLLYGTTFSGGSADAGVIYKVTLTGAYTSIAEFDSVLFSDGPGLDAPPTEGSDHNLYGTCKHGGQPSENGFVYCITPAGLFTNVHSFGGAAEPFLLFDENGGEPIGGVIMAADGALYGVTSSGGKGLVDSEGRTDVGYGVIYKVVPTGQFPFTRLAQFESVTGSPAVAHPRGSLYMAADGQFYGTTQAGGFGNGTIFKTTSGGTESVIVEFTGKTGAAPGAVPVDGLTGSGTTLYGATQNGGSATDDGIFFKVATDGTAFMPLVTFSGSAAAGGAIAGRFPAGIAADDGTGNLFGTTQQGGAGDAGTVFKLAGNLTASTVHEFTASEGSGIVSGLSLLGGKFYGTASAGGASGRGTFFSLTPDGTFAKLADFNGLGTPVKGGQPGALAVGPEGALYGTTFSGGVGSNPGLGTVFKVTTDGTVTTLAQFTGKTGATRGSFPQGPLYVKADGTIYGTTVGGGAQDYGTVFRIRPGNSLATMHEFSGLDGNSPRSGLILGADGMLYGTTEYGGLNGDQGSNSGAGTVFRVDPSGPDLPTLQTLGNSATGSTTATLRASVNPGGGATTVEFFLNDDSVGTVDAGSGSATITVEKSVTGLFSSSSYTVRATATNDAGTADGGTSNFVTTAPPNKLATVQVAYTAQARGIGASPVPGATDPLSGISTGATFASFGLPAIDEAGHLAFLGKFGKPVKSAIFGWNGTAFGPLAVVGQPAPGLAFNYTTLGEPALGGPPATAPSDYGRIAFIGKIGGKGVAGSSNTLLVSNATANGSLAVFARTGTPIAATGPLAGCVVSAIGTMAVDGGGSPCALMTFKNGPGVVAASNQALVRWVAGVPQVVVRKGDVFHAVAGKDRVVKLVGALIPATGSVGAARGPVQHHDLAPGCRVTFADKSQAVLDGTGTVIAFGGATGEMDKSFGLPAGGPVPAFLTTLTAVPRMVTAANNVEVLGPLNGALGLLARIGAAPAEYTGLPYKKIFDPVGGEDNGTAFTATFTGADVSAKNNLGLFWVHGDGTTARVVRTGEGIPSLGGVPLAAITSFALPPAGSTRGPIALGKLKTGAGGVLAAKAQVLVGRGSYDTVEKFLQAGDLLGNGKTVKIMTALGASAGSLAQGRSYNAAGQVVVLVTCTDGSTCLVNGTLP